LKTDPEVFSASWEGIKDFEVRFDDRNYRPGDTLTLKETAYSGEEMMQGHPLEYTGRELEQEVNYVLHGPCYGLKDDWVVMDVTVTGYRPE
jgi:hypothetical protein